MAPIQTMPLRRQKGLKMTVEYKVRAVTRYIVTRYENNGNIGGSTQHGTFDSGETAYQVAYALCRKDHVDSGEPVESVNFVYPEIPNGVSISPCPM